MSSHTETPGSGVSLGRRYPIDLLACTGLVICCWYAVTTLPAGSRLRMIVSLPLLTVLPGYALGAVLFPAAARQVGETGTGRGRSRGITTAERLGLALGLSIVVVAITILGLGIRPGPITTVPTTTAIATITAVSAIVGMWRRFRVPVSKRFTLRPDYWTGQLLDSGDSRYVTASVLVLVAAVALAGGALTYAIVTPVAGGSYTEIALYGEDENGSAEIGAVPEAVEPDSSIPITIELSNEHRQAQEYTVVVQEQTVTTGEPTNRTEVSRLQYDVGAGERERRTTTLVPGVGLDETVRVVALLYETDDGTVPTTPSMENADDYVYFHTHVTDDPDGDDTIVVG
ncbi:DUF1616 domain-containing protein [Halovivax asiaticus]|uniref:DUF1616 domain-containing protein n=1 Tax=Halovivax asiaticus TaxID=332953 RepID=UPI000677E29B|nr:DUF1616 domain-containing protein [Halovivax asiaticus]